MDNRFVHNFLMTERTEFADTIAQRSKRSGVVNTSLGMLPERRSTFSTAQSGFHNVGTFGCLNNNRMRNLSGGSVGSTTSGSSMGSCSNIVDNQYSSNNFPQSSSVTHFPLELSPFTSPAVHTSPSSSPSFLQSLPLSHTHGTNSNVSSRSGSLYSDNENNGSNIINGNSSSSERNGSFSSSLATQQQQSQRSVNSSRYKTELCRPFEESGSCKYGDKCQFAHGQHELRNLSRHPKYKTELCRTFHTRGLCPYGARCHFVHEEEPAPGGKVGGGDVSVASPKLARSGSIQSSSSGSSSPSLSPSGFGDNIFTDTGSLITGRHSSTLSVNTNFNSNANVSDALSRQLGGLNLNNDVFNNIGVFSEEDCLDNFNNGFKPVVDHRQQLDNAPSFSDSFWSSSLCGSEGLILSQMLGPIGSRNSSHHSPTGSASTDGISSSGSDSGSGSDCGGSTENLSNGGFCEWRGPVAITQY